MLYEFHVVHRIADEMGELKSIVIPAESEEEARALIAGPGIVIHRVAKGRALVDWGKDTYSRDEASVYLACHYQTIGELQKKGLLPKPRPNGTSVFHKSELEACRAALMQTQPVFGTERQKAAA